MEGQGSHAILTIFPTLVCWALHWVLKTESSLVFMKDKGWFYQVDTLGLLGLVFLRFQGLYRVIHWVIKKELVLAIN